MSDPFKRLSDGLGTLFTDLEQRVQAHADLAALVRNTLPGPEKDHIVSAAYRDDTLVILADSAVWCPQIRYAQQQLLEALAQAGETRFTKVKVRVGRRRGE
jgi:hypothetical protein